MIVCVCANVSDRDLDRHIAAGATTMKEIGRCCGAGVGCGDCRAIVRERLRDARTEAHGPPSMQPAVAAPAAA